MSVSSVGTANDGNAVSGISNDGSGGMEMIGSRDVSTGMDGNAKLGNAVGIVNPDESSGMDGNAVGSRPLGIGIGGSDIPNRLPNPKPSTQARIVRKHRVRIVLCNRLVILYIIHFCEIYTFKDVMYVDCRYARQV